MSSLVGLVKEMRARPAMYLGRRSISCLRSFLDGWLLGKPDSDSDLEILESFQAWIVSKYGVRGNQSWDRIILFYSQDEADGLDRFFDLFERFQELP